MLGLLNTSLTGGHLLIICRTDIFCSFAHTYALMIFVVLYIFYMHLWLTLLQPQVFFVVTVFVFVFQVGVSLSSPWLA